MGLLCARIHKHTWHRLKNTISVIQYLSSDPKRISYNGTWQYNLYYKPEIFSKGRSIKVEKNVCMIENSATIRLCRETKFEFYLHEFEESLRRLSKSTFIIMAREKWKVRRRKGSDIGKATPRVFGESRRWKIRMSQRRRGRFGRKIASRNICRFVRKKSKPCRKKMRTQISRVRLKKLA